jgi:predicted AAA+ superfamily ATPase
VLVCGKRGCGSSADGERTVGELTKGFMLKRPIGETDAKKIRTAFPVAGEFLAGKPDNVLIVLKPRYRALHKKSPQRMFEVPKSLKQLQMDIINLLEYVFDDIFQYKGYNIVDPSSFSVYNSIEVIEVERAMMTELVKWKDNPKRKPLIVQGVRQSGKTYLIKEFGERHYEDVACFKFDEDETLADFFSPNLDPHRIVKEITLARGKDIKPGKTLIFFDGIQVCGKALTALKYFNEDAPEYDVVAAGSLLGVAIPKGTSFPVGKVDFLTLYPMSFYEFIYAHNEKLAMTLSESNLSDTIWQSFGKQLSELYRDFLVIGGMPEVVSIWIETHSIEKAIEAQRKILLSYQSDFAKYAPLNYYPKIAAVWQSIPSQLGKENRKFIFSQVKKSWRARDLEDALEWLIRAGLVYKIENIEKPYFPVSSYASHTFFKLYLSDVGLLREMSDLPTSILFDKTNNYREFKGAMAENYVCSELKKLYNKDIYYWTREGTAKAEVDFIVQDNECIIPIEVKAGSASHAQSLTQYCKTFKPEKSVLTSMDAGKKNILPLFAFWKFKEYANDPERYCR